MASDDAQSLRRRGGEPLGRSAEALAVGLPLGPVQPRLDAPGGVDRPHRDRRAVEGLALDVATGIFLSSFNAAGASDATQVDLNSGFDAATYPLDLKAETTALEGAKQKLVDAFNGLKAANGAH